MVLCHNDVIQNQNGKSMKPCEVSPPSSSTNPSLNLPLCVHRSCACTPVPAMPLLCWSTFLSSSFISLNFPFLSLSKFYPVFCPWHVCKTYSMLEISKVKVVLVQVRVGCPRVDIGRRFPLFPLSPSLLCSGPGWLALLLAPPSHSTHLFHHHHQFSGAIGSQIKV